MEKEQQEIADTEKEREAMQVILFRNLNNQYFFSAHWLAHFRRGRNNFLLERGRFSTNFFFCALESAYNAWFSVRRTIVYLNPKMALMKLTACLSSRSSHNLVFLLYFACEWQTTFSWNDKTKRFLNFWQSLSEKTIEEDVANEDMDMVSF